MKHIILITILCGLVFATPKEDALPIFDVCSDVGTLEMDCNKISKAIATAYALDEQTDARLFSVCYRICKDPIGYKASREAIIERIKEKKKGLK